MSSRWIIRPKLGRPTRFSLSAIAAALIVTVFVLIPQLAQSEERRNPPPLPQIHGLVRTPPLFTVNVVAPGATFFFSGWVNFSGANGYVQMDVLKSGNGPSVPDELWVSNVAGRIRPSLTPARFVDGENQYEWSVVPSRPFAQNRWPDGGTARARFKAIYVDPDSRVETVATLPVQDAQLVQGRIPELILADANPTPAATLAPEFLNGGLRFGANNKPRLTLMETVNYYERIGTDPDGNGPSIADRLSTEEAFKDHYFRPPLSACPYPDPLPSIPGTTATYFNQGDLGLGREMHCIANGCTRETACYVRNFGKIDDEGKAHPEFGHIEETRKALKAMKPFATVAMVERHRMPLGAPNSIFFVVYVPQKDPITCPAPGELACAAQLDKRQFNTSIPTNCLVCHGSASSYDPNKAEIRNASFLPFDLASFRYYGSDPSDPLSRPAQEGQFKRLNLIMYLSDLFFNFDAYRLLNGWYDYDDDNILLPFSPGRPFRDDFVPKGWAQDTNAQQLYLHVVAPACQTCHISHSSSFGVSSDQLRFANFGDLEEPVIKGFISLESCQAHIMPNAEQTSNIFWESSARPHLLNRLDIQSGCGLDPHAAATLASAESKRPPLEVLRDYKAESCGCTSRECLKAVENKHVGEFAAMRFDNSYTQGAFHALISEALECRQQVLNSDSPPNMDLKQRVLDRELEIKELLVH